MPKSHQIPPEQWFGYNSCEEEYKALGDYWHKLFSDDLPFMREVVNPRSCIIVGKWGTGKSALIKYLERKQTKDGGIPISVAKSDELFARLEPLAGDDGDPDELIIPNLVKVWTSVFWWLVFGAFAEDHPQLRASYDALVEKSGARPPDITLLIKGIVEQYLGSSTSRYVREMEDFLERVRFEQSKKLALTCVEQKPVIICIESLDKYTLKNVKIRRLVAALVQASHEFVMEHAGQGIEIKTFISGEAFTRLRERALLNPSKHAYRPVNIRWDPQTLAIMICRRLYCFQEMRGGAAPQLDNIDWADYRAVLEKLWEPYFGRIVRNRRGRNENSFLYVVRHTQCRPRQLIHLCNNITELACKGSDECFPPEYITEGVRIGEADLAEWNLGAYEPIWNEKYQRALGHVLVGISKVYPPSLVERRLAAWRKETNESIDSGEFRRYIVNMGVVGVLRKLHNEEKILEVDYDFFSERDLNTTNIDRMVVHPMFFEKYRVESVSPRSDYANAIVFPFPINDGLLELAKSSLV